ncbi:sporulation histidine kinase inhibitor Sda [Alkalibacillus sp. S2W]
MYDLSKSTLIEAYQQAIKQNLAEDFIKLIEKELHIRGIQPDEIK